MKFPGIISNAESEIKLIDCSMEYLKTPRYSIRYLYDNPAVTYTQLLVASRKAEAEVSDGKSGTMTMKAKSCYSK